MKILKGAKLIPVIERSYHFESRTHPGSGFSFDVDADGKPTADTAAGRANLAKCLNGGYDVVDKGIREHRRSYVEPAIGECDNCGRKVTLDGFTNTCRCGADYNQSGQRLADRSQWGEETGEHPSDILRIP